MDDTSNTAGSDQGVFLRYYVAVGLIAAGAVGLFSVLPQSVAGVTLVAAAVLIAVIDRYVHKRFHRSPLQSPGPAYLAIVGAVVIGALALTWTLARGSWTAWVLAAAVGAVIVGGAWVAKKHS